MGEWRMVVPSWPPGACVRTLWGPGGLAPRGLRIMISITAMKSFSNKRVLFVLPAWRAVEEMSVARQVLESLSESPTVPQNCPKRLP